jgi:hypothetical protein
MQGMELALMLLWLFLLVACIVVGNKHGGNSKEVKPYIVGFLLTTILGFAVS